MVFQHLQKDSIEMADKVKSINENMAKKFIERERQVGRMMATITTLFFLVFLINPIIRQVRKNRNDDIDSL